MASSSTKFQLVLALCLYSGSAIRVTNDGWTIVTTRSNFGDKRMGYNNQKSSPGSDRSSGSSSDGKQSPKHYTYDIEDFANGLDDEYNNTSGEKPIVEPIKTVWRKNKGKTRGKQINITTPNQTNFETFELGSETFEFDWNNSYYQNQKGNVVKLVIHEEDGLLHGLWEGDNHKNFAGAQWTYAAQHHFRNNSKIFGNDTWNSWAPHTGGKTNYRDNVFRQMVHEYEYHGRKLSFKSPDDYVEKATEMFTKVGQPFFNEMKKKQFDFTNVSLKLSSGGYVYLTKIAHVSGVGVIALKICFLEAEAVQGKYVITPCK